MNTKDIVTDNTFRTWRKLERGTQIKAGTAYQRIGSGERYDPARAASVTAAETFKVEDERYDYWVRDLQEERKIRESSNHRVYHKGWWYRPCRFLETASLAVLKGGSVREGHFAWSTQEQDLTARFYVSAEPLRYNPSVYESALVKLVGDGFSVEEAVSKLAEIKAAAEASVPRESVVTNSEN